MPKKRKISPLNPTQAVKKPKFDRTTSQDVSSPAEKKPKEGVCEDEDVDNIDSNVQPTSLNEDVSEPGPKQDAVHRESPLIPPLADDVLLRKNHDIHVIAIGASSKIEGKVRQLLSLLRDAHRHAIIPKDQKTNEKLSLVVLVARAPFANKCVSVVEVAKREYLATNDPATRLYQYTAVWLQLEPYKDKHKDSTAPKRKETMEKDQSNNHELEEKDEHAKTKVRNVSCLAIYMSLKSVHKLKELYSEQVTADKQAG